VVRSIVVVAAVLAGVSSLVATPARAGGDPIAVCIGKDGAMRVIEGTGPCGTGEQKKLFAEWEQEAEEAPDDDEVKGKISLEKRVEELANRVAALEKRPDQSRPDKTESLQVEELSARVEALAKEVAALQNNKGGDKGGKATAQRVTAPFEVVGRNGVVILRVAETVSSTTGNGARVTIGAGQAGNYAVRVHKDGGPFVAGIGQSTAGAGLAIVMDGSGNIAANMNGSDRRIAVYKDGSSVAGMVAEDRGGTIAVYEGMHAIAYLTKSTAGDGGNVTTALNNGEGVFSAGAAQDGGGEACVNRVTGGGQKRGACLGIELPSMGLGK
jgi:hypothetical protein